MAGDILRKRKIAVLGSRSVGMFHLSHKLLMYFHSNRLLFRKVFPRHPVRGWPFRRILLPNHRIDFYKEYETQWG